MSRKAYLPRKRTGVRSSLFDIVFFATNPPSPPRNYRTRNEGKRAGAEIASESESNAHLLERVRHFYSTMSLPPALQARLLKRGLLKDNKKKDGIDDRVNW